MGAPAPMGGASDIPEGPMGPTGPQGDPAGMPMDGPAQMGPMDNGQLDPNMEGPDMGGDPNAMGEDPAAMGGEGGDDSTMSIINQLSPEDREAVRSYAESMLARDETKDEEPMGNEAPMDGGAPTPEGTAPMMESFVFTKKQIKKINENLQNLEPEEDDEKNKGLEKKKDVKNSNKSPFKSPKFN